ncbi:MAG TPA: ABC transporter substrate-binding protein, partial [Homoserinimonas sp.]|nr:ABC transporter substrate-binding protein [Homoserinimonas sp.]
MNMRNNRALRLGLAPLGALAAISLLASCAGSGTAPAGKADIVLAVKDDPVCLDPQQVTLTTALNIGRQVVDSLVDQDAETGEIVPWLAETWETNDDLTEFTFNLRDDVTFSDESALTATTVKANFDALFEMGAAASLASQYLAGYTGTEVVDEDTATVSFDAPNAQFLQGASTITLGLVSDASAAATPEERCQEVIGSGPFTVDSYISNDSLVLVKREGYNWASELRGHQGEALVDSITFPITPENGVRSGGLQTGEFDIIQDLPAVDEARFDTGDYNIYARANPGVPHSLVPNTSRPIVGNEAVRQAMLLATDRAEITALTGSSKSDPASGALSSATPGYVSQADALEYDQDEAIKILEEDGWELGEDGIREKDGTKLTVGVTAFYGQDVLEATQIQLAKVGINLELNMVTAGDFFGAIASRDYDFLGAGLTRTDPDVLRVMFSADAVSKWAIVDDAELESMLQEQARSADPQKRQELIADIQKT